MAPSLLEKLTPDTQAKALEFLAAAEAAGFRLKIISTLRTCSEQNRLYAQGRTRPGKVVTHAQGCMSWHVLGRAFDVMIVEPRNPSIADWKRLGEVGKSIGLLWGGDFKGFFDGPHFEWHPGKTIADFCKNPARCEEAYEASMAWQSEAWATTSTPLDDPAWGGNSLDGISHAGSDAGGGEATDARDATQVPVDQKAPPVSLGTAMEERPPTSTPSAEEPQPPTPPRLSAAERLKLAKQASAKRSSRGGDR